MGRALSPQIVAFLESGVSIQVGTRDSSLFPASVRGVGARRGSGADEVVVFVPGATAASTVANLRDNGRVAVCLSEIATHRTLQLKGRALDVEPATDADRPLIERYRGALATALAFVGLPARLTYRLAHWPAVAVRLRVEEVFEQTPGPGAGDPLGEAAG